MLSGLPISFFVYILIYFISVQIKDALKNKPIKRNERSRAGAFQDGSRQGWS